MSEALLFWSSMIWFFFWRIISSSSRVSITWLVVEAEAGVMVMDVDVSACCCGVVVAWVWVWRGAHRLPRIAFKHHPCLKAHMQTKISNRITATATDAPTSRWSIDGDGDGDGDVGKQQESLWTRLDQLFLLWSDITLKSAFVEIFSKKRQSYLVVIAFQSTMLLCIKKAKQYFFLGGWLKVMEIIWLVVRNNGKFLFGFGAIWIGSNYSCNVH